VESVIARVSFPFHTQGLMAVLVNVELLQLGTPKSIVVVLISSGVAVGNRYPILEQRAIACACVYVPGSQLSLKQKRVVLVL
jgi:hypothetical protein